GGAGGAGCRPPGEGWGSERSSATGARRRSRCRASGDVPASLASGWTSTRASRKQPDAGASAECVRASIEVTKVDAPARRSTPAVVCRLFPPTRLQPCSRARERPRPGMTCQIAAALGSADVVWIVVAVALHLAGQGVRGLAWHGVLHWSWPGSRRRSVCAWHLCGAGLSGVLSSRGADVVRLGLARRELHDASVPALAGTLILE